MKMSAMYASWQKFDTLAHSRPIHNENEYDHMIKLMNLLLDASGDDEDHPLSGLLDLVGDLVSRYEQEHLTIDIVDPNDALRFLMDAQGLKQDDLFDIVHQSNLSAILSGKRKISATLPGKLGIYFGTSSAIFVPA